MNALLRNSTPEPDENLQISFAWQESVMCSQVDVPPNVQSKMYALDFWLGSHFTFIIDEMV